MDIPTKELSILICFSIEHFLMTKKNSNSSNVEQTNYTGARMPGIKYSTNG